MGTPLQEHARLVGVPGHQGKENLRHGMHRFLVALIVPSLAAVVENPQHDVFSFFIPQRRHP